MAPRVPMCPPSPRPGLRPPCTLDLRHPPHPAALPCAGPEHMRGWQCQWAGAVGGGIACPAVPTCFGSPQGGDCDALPPIRCAGAHAPAAGKARVHREHRHAGLRAGGTVTLNKRVSKPGHQRGGGGAAVGVLSAGRFLESPVDPFQGPALRVCSPRYSEWMGTRGLGAHTGQSHAISTGGRGVPAYGELPPFASHSCGYG